MLQKKSRGIAALLAIVMALSMALSACKKPEGGGNATNSGGLEPLGEGWSSEGGAYKQTYMDAPKDFRMVFAHDSDIYTITAELGFSESNYGEIWRNNTEKIYTLEGGYIFSADISDEGLWLYEFDTNIGDRKELKLISFSGELIQTLLLTDIFEYNENLLGIRYCNNFLYLRTIDRIIKVSTAGEKIAAFSLDTYNVGVVFGKDGEAYIVCYYDDRIELNHIAGDSLDLACTISEADARVFSGDETHYLTLSNSEGLFGLEGDGAITPIVIWRDCGIAMQSLTKIFALPNGEYICWDAGGISKLSPASPSEITKKTELVLAIVGEANIKATVANFNRRNSEYTVVIKDYSEGGSYDTATAITRLNTEIISNKHPDLFLFNGLSPFVYINKGYMLDLGEFIDSDEELCREDIVIIDQLENSGGIYYMSSRFYIETMGALYSEFGDRYGWTLDEYLEIEKNMPSNAETLYNTTKSQFLRRISSRYLKTAVDWEAGKCDFDNDTFIAMLEAGSRVKENPEPENPSQLDVTYGSVRVAKGTLVAALTMTEFVWKLAFEEQMAGCPLSFIGWPTVDGSCGSDLYIYEPVGISAQTSSPEGCWEFIKFMLTDIDPDTMIFLPAYMPYLQAQIEKAIREKPTMGIPPSMDFQMTDADGRRLFALLAEIDNVAIYDEVILGIIEEEASIFFVGDKTAQKTASTIQSRVQLYISEQY